jgi:hypothetical protein
MRYPLFWIGSSNFGDAVNSTLYKVITCEEPVYSEVSPKIIAIGSLAHTAGPKDIVWGTGAMSEDLPLKCDSTTRVMATRGPLTDELLRQRGASPSGIHGDPALLLPKFFHMNEEKKYKLGVIPHYADYEEVVKMDLGKIINLFESPLEVIKSICQCEKVISSSLHGIIAAEAYGVPAGWVEFSNKVAGNGFKFYDYYLGTGRELNAVAPNPDFYWESPIIDNRLLEVCPFNWDSRWENDLPVCTGRNKRIAELIAPGSSVLDIGAGKMELKGFLKGCRYQPVDFIKRCDETIVCDLNGIIYLPSCDVAVFSGVLEYIKNIPHVLGKLNAKTIIASYMVFDMNASLENRRFNGWVNDFTEDEIVKLFSFCGFKLEQCETLGTQVIFQFSSMKGSPSCSLGALPIRTRKR